jgi:hypothetical protein
MLTRRPPAAGLLPGGFVPEHRGQPRKVALDLRARREQTVAEQRSRVRPPRLSDDGGMAAALHKGWRIVYGLA